MTGHPPFFRLPRSPLYSAKATGHGLPNDRSTLNSHDYGSDAALSCPPRRRAGELSTCFSGRKRCSNVFSSDASLSTRTVSLDLFGPEQDDFELPAVPVARPLDALQRLG